MTKLDIVVLTEDRYVAPKETDTYIENILLEDQLVIDALRKEGLKAERKSWSDPDFDWSTTKYVLFRTTWDYFDRFEEFNKWLTSVSAQTTLLNSAKIINWNIDKHYLNDLKEQGVPVCETHFIKKGTQTNLKELHKQLGWTKTVLKPCISGAARHTYKLTNETIDAYENIFQQLINHEDMMLQPFQENILTKGEYSFIVIDGTYSHAVLKIAKPGDFRVQDDFGGTVHQHVASTQQIAFAENAVKACVELPIYARVDVIIDNTNALAISEIELIEPELWFRNAPEAATKLAKGIKKRMQ